MNGTFSIDLKNISLGEFQKMIETAVLLPGRKILKEDLAARFEILAGAGVENLADLLNKSNTDKKMAALAGKTGLPEEYLIILKREAGSFLSKPVNLNEYPGVKPALIDKLLQKGIKNSRQLFEKAGNKAERTAISAQLSVSESELLNLLELADLTRINGVGPVFAVMLQLAGLLSVKDMQNADTEVLFAQLMKINTQGNYTKAVFTEKDLQSCVRFARFMGTFEQ